MHKVVSNYLQVHANMFTTLGEKDLSNLMPVFILSEVMKNSMYSKDKCDYGFSLLHGMYTKQLH